MDRIPHQAEPRQITARPTIVVRRRSALPTALAAAVLIGGIAFGASFQPSSSPTDAESTAGSSQAAVGPSATAAPVVVAGHKGPGDSTYSDRKSGTVPGAHPSKSLDPHPTDAIKPDPTVKPTKAPEPKPAQKATPKPTVKPAANDAGSLGLSLAVKETKVVIDFTACTAAKAEYYKVVRSTDSTVTWPAGKNDSGIAAIGIGDVTKAWDGGAPSGTKVWYRVFCVRHGDDGYVVLAASPAKSITAPDVPAAPQPSAMWVSATSADGTVTLTWEPSGTDGFKLYKVLRKADDGTKSVVAELTSVDATTFVDAGVEVGRTYHYQVTAFAWWHDQKIVAGATDWVSVAVE